MPCCQIWADPQDRGFTPISWLRFSSCTAVTTAYTASNSRAEESCGEKEERKVRWKDKIGASRCTFRTSQQAGECSIHSLSEGSERSKILGLLRGDRKHCFPTSKVLQQHPAAHLHPSEGRETKAMVSLNCCDCVGITGTSDTHCQPQSHSQSVIFLLVFLLASLPFMSLLACSSGVLPSLPSFCLYLSLSLPILFYLSFLK